MHRGTLHTGKEEAHARYRSIEEGKKYGPTLGIAFSYLHGQRFLSLQLFQRLFLCFISGDDLSWYFCDIFFFCNITAACWVDECGIDDE